MTCRNLITFGADFPDDSQWDEQGNQVVPGGQAIIQAIKLQLTLRDVACSEVAQHSFYGWVFDTALKNAKLRIILAAVFPEGDGLVHLEPQRTLISRLFVRDEPPAFESL